MDGAGSEGGYITWSDGQPCAIAASEAAVRREQPPCDVARRGEATGAGEEEGVGKGWGGRMQNMARATTF